MRRLWSRRGVIGAIAGVGASALVRPAAAQGTASQSTFERVKATGVLKIGIADNIPWSRLNPDGTMIGIAPETVLEVTKRWGISKVEAIVTTYGQLVPGLLAGRWDMVGAALTITPERCAQVIFGDPFYRADDKEWAGYLPGTVTGSPPKSFLEMAQRFDRIGSTGGAQTPFLRAAIEKAGNKAELVQFGEVQSMIEGLMTKRVPIVTADKKTMQLLHKQRGGFEIVPVDSGQPNRGSGPAFRKEDADFREAFVKEHRMLKQSGLVKKILEKYDFEYDEAFMNVSGDEACKL